MELPTVATCPLAGGAKRPLVWAKGASSIEGKRVESPPTFIQGKHRENQNGKVEGLRILKMRVRELFTHGEGISTPRVRHKGRQPLIECANHDFKIMYFPFYVFYFFCGRQWCFPHSYVSSIAMRKSDLRNSFKNLLDQVAS